MYSLYSLKLQKNIAYHFEKRVVRKYKDNYEKNNPDTLIIKKIKCKELPQEYDELYLVKYGNDYLQSKYLEVMEVDESVTIDDYFYAHDVIMKLCYDLSYNKKKIKKLLKADSIILQEVKKSNPYCYDMRSLEERKREHEMWKNKSI